MNNGPLRSTILVNFIFIVFFFKLNWYLLTDSMVRKYYYRQKEVSARFRFVQAIEQKLYFLTISLTIFCLQKMRTHVDCTHLLKTMSLRKSKRQHQEFLYFLESGYTVTISHVSHMIYPGPLLIHLLIYISSTCVTSSVEIVKEKKYIMP